MQPCTVGDVIALYLVHTRADQNPRTYDDRQRVLRAFVAAHGTLLLTDAKPWHLRLWVNGQTRWKSNWTKRRGIGSVRAAFGWALQLGLIDRNPFIGTNCPMGERGQAVEPREFQAMLRASRAIFRRVLVFMRFSGARPGEMSAAEWRHVDWPRCCIVLREHKTGKRTGRPRTIVLHPVLMNLLEWIRRHKPHERFIFVNKYGRPWKNTSICWRIKQIRKSADVPADVTLYHCRHAFVTQAVLRGVDIALVSELAGHSRIATTQVYLHLAGRTDHLQAAIRRAFG